MKKLSLLVIAILAFTFSGVVAKPGIRQVNLKEIKGLSMAQIMSKAQELIKDNNEMYNAMLDSLGKSNQAKDSSKAGCLMNLSPAMKGLVRIGQQSLLNLKELSATGNRNDAESQFVKVVISHRKMLEMYDTAQQCGSVNMKQVFEKGVHVERELLSGIPTYDVVGNANQLTSQEDPFSGEQGFPLDRFVMVDNVNVVPATDFY